MMILVVTLFLKISPTLAAAECSYETYFGSCDQVQKAGPILKRFSDGSLLGNMFKVATATEDEKKRNAFRDELATLSRPIDQDAGRVRRLKEIFDKVKQTYRKIILNGLQANNSKLTPQQNSALKRLELLELADKPNEMFCAGSPINAYYMPSEHTLAVCHALANSPTATLIFIMGHEIGHAIDSCRMNNTLLQLKSNVGKLKCKDRKLAKDLTFGEKPSTLVKRAGKVIVADEASIHKDMILRCGFGTETVPALQMADSDPLGATLACVVTSQGAKLPKEMEAQKFEEFARPIREQFRQQNQSMSSGQFEALWKQMEPSLRETFEKVERERAQIAHQVASCGQLASFMGIAINSDEATADLMSSQVLGEILSEKGALTEEEKLGVVGFQSTVLCANKVTDGTKFNSSLYPAAQQRLDILFQNPKIAAALGCEFKGKAFCDPAEVRRRMSLVTPTFGGSETIK